MAVAKKLTKKQQTNYVENTETAVSIYTMKAGTLVKGLDLLTTLSAKASEISLAELANAVAIDKSTARRILAVMTAMGFVAKDETTNRYSLGAQFRALTSLSYGQLQEAAVPLM